MAPQVLAVEDVAVNRELIHLILEPLGYAVDGVGDGEQAVAAVSGKAYDIVLMDLQMPVMDGLEATRAIRALGGAHARLPILGLSANVRPDEVDRCLEAGMNAHLGKPFSATSLHAAIQRCLGEGAAPAAGPKAPDEGVAARLAGFGPDERKGLLDLFELQLKAMEGAALDDTETLTRQAHKLRGGSLLLGLTALAGACDALEHAADDAARKTALTDVYRQVRQARRELRAFTAGEAA